MSLRVNLYHEVLRAKRQEQYDPLKISFLGLLVVGVAMVGYYFVQLKRTSDVRSAYNVQKAEFDRLSPLSKTAAEREIELTKQIDLAERVTNRMGKRFLWAPVLESIVSAVPPNVQLTKFMGDTGKEKGGGYLINLEGIAAGQEPRAVAEDTRKTIADRFAAKYANVSATFKNLDDSAERVRVDGKPMASVVFTISVTFKPTVEPIPNPKRIAQTK